MSAGSGTTDNPEKLLNLLHRSENPEFSEPKPESGKALKDVTGVGTKWYIPITTTEAGSYAVQIGPTEEAVHKIIPTTELAAKAGPTVLVNLPANWWIKITVTKATLGTPVVTT